MSFLNFFSSLVSPFSKKPFFGSNLKPRIMLGDQFLQLIDSQLIFTTREMILYIGVMASTAEDYKKVLERFQVKTITHCKDEFKAPFHEILILQLHDTSIAAKGSKAGDYFVSLERTASDTRSAGPVSNLKEVQSKFVKSFSSSKERLGYQAVSDTDLPPRLPFLDTSSLASAGSADICMGSISSSSLAVDTFRGGKAPPPASRIVRQLKIAGDLPFFDFVILAHSVHEHKPDYTPLGTNCFWFAQTICAMVEDLYVCDKVVTGPLGGLGQPSVRPSSDYLPNIAGRVGGFMVVGPSDEDLSDLVEVFKADLAAKLATSKADWDSFHGKITTLGAEVTTLGAEVATLGAEVNRLEGIETSLNAQVIRMAELLRAHNINPDSDSPTPGAC